MKSSLAALALVAVLMSSSSPMASASDEAKEAELSTLTYDASKFKEQVPNVDHFVMFYAPWCGHCKRLHPAWEELAKKHNDLPEAERTVLIAKVDCTIETALCSDHDVTGYPTIKYFKKGEDSSEKYRGGRDLDALEKFVQKQLGNVKEEEETVGEPEVAKVEKGLYVLSDKSFASHIKTGDHFIKFYAPWCGHCQKLAPIWDDLAKDFESDKVVKVAKLDCTGAQSVCQEQEVKGYPTLVYYRNGKKVETYRGARNFNELKDFLNSMQEKPAASKDTEEKDRVPTEDAGKASPVVHINQEDFVEQIKSGLTLVKFFAPWCGHCKRLAPTWDELATKFQAKESVKIAKVDCTSNENKNKELCNEQGVNGFPSILLYKDGAKVEEYQGKRTLEDLVSFVEKHSEKPKDEL